MGIEAWGEWAAVLVILATGFGLLYAKVSSIVTRIDGIVTQIGGLVTRMKEDHEEHLRIWGKLDKHGNQNVEQKAKLADHERRIEALEKVKGET